MKLAPAAVVGGESEAGCRLYLAPGNDLGRAGQRLADVAAVDRSPGAAGIDHTPGRRSGCCESKAKQDDEVRLHSRRANRVRSRAPPSRQTRVRRSPVPTTTNVSRSRYSTGSPVHSASRFLVTSPKNARRSTIS